MMMMMMSRYCFLVDRPDHDWQLSITIRVWLRDCHAMQTNPMRSHGFSTLGQAPWDPYWTNSPILADGNLWSFQTYCQFYATRHEIKMLSHAFMVIHDGPWDPGESPKIVVNSRYGVWEMPERPCMDKECFRCLNLRGGYKFSWVGRWTPRGAFVKPGESRQEVSRRCMEPWPTGVLERPRPFRGP